MIEEFRIVGRSLGAVGHRYNALMPIHANRIVRHGRQLLLCLTIWLSAAGSASAVPVPELFAGEAQLEAGSAGDLEPAFTRALGNVLIKVTGRREAGQLPFVNALAPNPTVLVQQYRVEEDGTVWARFDPVAVRRALDESGQPIWGRDRPETLIWLAMDLGGGERVMVNAASDGEASNSSSADEEDPLDMAREILAETSDARGLPVVLPLMDSDDLAAVSFADVWGDFSEPVLQASTRYGVGAILVGRSQGAPDRARVRWSLFLGDERTDWTGNLADGPHGAADYLAARLATYADTSGRLMLVVTGVNSLEDYARVLTYLENLDAIETLEVRTVAGDRVEFSVLVRGSAEQLDRAIGLKSILQPQSDTVGGTADLSYGLSPGF